MEFDQHGNAVLKEGFTQVCVWPGTIVCNTSDGFAPENAQKFEVALLKDLGCRAQYLEEIITLPDTDENGNSVPETGGGRNDLFFAMHDEDVGKVAVKRLALGIRWLEDVLAPVNYHSKIYPDRVRFYQTWPLDGTIIEERPATASPAEEKLSKVISRVTSRPAHEEKVTMNENTEQVEAVKEQPSISTEETQTQALAYSLFALLRPQIETLVAAMVNKAIKELGLDEQIESAVSSKIDELGLERLFDSNEFNDAVHEAVSNMDFSTSVEGRRGRYR